MSAAVWNEPPVNQPADPSRMTIRISRDSGRTWGPLVEVRAGERDRAPLQLSTAFPPCTCPRHRNRSETCHLTENNGVHSIGNSKLFGIGRLVFDG